MSNHDNLPRETGHTYRTIKVTPLSAALAADIEAGDLRAITEQQFAEIKRAWLSHHVIRCRGQRFTNADMVAFGRRFGDFQPNNPGTLPAVRPDEIPRVRVELHPHLSVEGPSGS